MGADHQGVRGAGGLTSLLRRRKPHQRLGVGWRGQLVQRGHQGFELELQGEGGAMREVRNDFELSIGFIGQIQPANDPSNDPLARAAYTV